MRTRDFPPSTISGSRYCFPQSLRATSVDSFPVPEGEERALPGVERGSGKPEAAGEAGGVPGSPPLHSGGAPLQPQQRTVGGEAKFPSSPAGRASGHSASLLLAALPENQALREGSWSSLRGLWELLV